MSHDLFFFMEPFWEIKGERSLLLPSRNSPSRTPSLFSIVTDTRRSLGDGVEPAVLSMASLPLYFVDKEGLKPPLGGASHSSAVVSNVASAANADAAAAARSPAVSWCGLRGKVSIL